MDRRPDFPGFRPAVRCWNLVTFAVTQLAMGITVLIARYLGEKRPQEIGAVIGGATLVFAGISVVLFILMVGFAHPISRTHAGT